MAEGFSGGFTWGTSGFLEPSGEGPHVPFHGEKSVFVCLGGQNVTPNGNSKKKFTLGVSELKGVTKVARVWITNNRDTSVCADLTREQLIALADGALEAAAHLADQEE